LQGTIAYPAFDGRTYNIYLADVAEGTSKFYRAEASQPAFNNTGSRLAFLSWTLGTRGLVTASSSGGNDILISSFVEDKLPSWSPDESKILFLSRRAGSRVPQLYLTAANVDFQSNTANYMTEGEYPTWGPSQIVFKGWGNTGTGLRLASSNLTGIEPLTSSSSDTAPALSPDEQQIAFMSQRDGNWEIYLINSDGSNLRRLTNNSANDGLPTWSPDGKAIAFASNRGEGWAVWAVSAEDTVDPKLQKLFDMAGSPDGVVLSDSPNSTGWLEERISWTP
jgi:Tol biopolymer transport system component